MLSISDPSTSLSRYRQRGTSPDAPTPLGQRVEFALGDSHSPRRRN